MPTLESLIADNPGKSDAEIAGLYNAQPPSPRPSNPASTYVTYLSIDQMPAPFGGNVSGLLRTGLLAWCDGPDLSVINADLPNPGRLRNLHDRLAGSPGVDLTAADAPALLQLFAAGVAPASLSPLLTAEQSAALLAIGSVIPSTTEAEVAAIAAPIRRRLDIAADDAEVTAAYADATTLWNTWARERDIYVRDGGTRPTKPTLAELVTFVAGTLGEGE